ncbi:stereocilin [Patella vulgata]|uniref:stereocilin n=1 Tax=Patella vulgata TaxID=6465 RepID=UPI0024A94D1C|nr:stereocilin [Patella vulgata]XP_050392809.2 stereocilin [Patella vulgata]
MTIFEKPQFKTFIVLIMVMILYVFSYGVAGDNTTTPVPVVDKVKEQCLKLIKLYTLQRKEYRIPSACRKYEQVSNVTAASLLAEIKKPTSSKEHIHQIIRHPSFPSRLINSFVLLLLNETTNLKSEAREVATEALLEKNSNFQVPRQIALKDILFLNRLVMYLPGYFITRMSHDAFDYLIDTIHNFTISNSAATPMTLVTEHILDDPMRHRSLCTKASSMMTKSKSMINDHVKKIFYLMNCLPASICSSLSVNVIQSNLQLLMSVPWSQSCALDTVSEDKRKRLKEHNLKAAVQKGSGCARKIANKLLENDIDTSKWDDIKKISPILICMSDTEVKNVLNKVDCTQAKDGLLQMDTDNSKAVMKAIASRCVFKTVQASELTCNELKNFASFLTSVPLSFLRSVPKTALCGNDCQKVFFKGVGNYTMPSLIKNYVLKTCGLIGPLDSAALSRLGGMVIKLPMNKLKTLSATDLGNILSDVKTSMKTDMRKDPRRNVMMRNMAKKLLGAGTISRIADNRDFMRQLSLKDLKSVQDVSSIYKSNTTIDLPDSQNKFFMKKVLETKRIDNMSAADVREMKSLVKGLISKQISEFNPMYRMEIAAALCEQTNWPMKSIRAINRNLIVESLKGKASTAPMKIFTAMDVENLGCECLLHFKSEELKEMTYEACTTTCTAIGSCPKFKCLNPQQRRSVLNACLTCMNLTSSQLSVEDISSLGPNLVQQLTSSEFDNKISASIISSLLSYFQGGCITVDLRNALKKKILEGKGNTSTFDMTVFEELQELIMIFTEEEQKDMDMAALNGVTENILKVLNPTENTDIEIQKCCDRWMSKQDKAIIKSSIKSLYSTIMKAKRAAFESTNSRKKRQTETWTCSDIQSVGQAFTDISVSELLAISNTEFSSCIQHLGTLTGWTSDQLNVLYNRTENLLANSCNMTESEISSIGNIALGMTVTDINCLNMTSDDAVSALGSLSVWTTAQLTALAEQCKSDRIISVSSLSSDDLTALGHILCGFRASELNTINATAVSNCGSQLGSLSPSVCSISHIQALTSVVLQPSGYGHSSTWDAAVFSELGILIAGLSSNNFANMSISAIEGMSVTAIPNIPSSALKAMSVAQLQSFSSQQAIAVTQSQRAAMSIDQRNALSTAAYGDFANLASSKSGTGSTSPVVVQMTLTVIMGILCLCLFLPS